MSKRPTRRPSLSPFMLGKLEGLREARQIAGAGHFKPDPETVAEGVVFHARAVCAKLDSRIAELSPEASRG